MTPEFTRILDAQVEALKKRLAELKAENDDLRKLIDFQRKVIDFQMKRKPVPCLAHLESGLM
jgi:cell shape-determining protein MreC